MSLTGRPAYRVIHRVCGLLGALTTAGVVMVAVAPAASAHATLLFTSPAAGSAVPTSPRVITLTFNEPVTLAGKPVTLAGTGGRRLGLAGTTHAIGVSGHQFLASEPYAGGVAPVADLVTGNGGHRVLLLGFPDAGIWAQLTLGVHGAPDRVAHEILVDPDHLTSRGFAYPEKAGRTT